MNTPAEQTPRVIEPKLQIIQEGLPFTPEKQNIGLSALGLLPNTIIQPILTVERNIKRQTRYYIEEQEEGGFVAYSEEYSGAVGQGETEEEAIKDLKEAIELLKEVIEEDAKAKVSLVKT
jgi:predicted RNase H-like HicB family nuclease